MGCRAKTQTVDGILAAQTIIGVLRRKHQVEAHVAKLDIRAAFDSLSHASIVHYLLHCKPSREAILLWRMCSGNKLKLSLGTEAWDVKVQQGIMQGSSYSADLFSRVIDFRLRDLQSRWSDLYPRWKDTLGLPHFLLYADDIMLFAMDAPELQAKLRDLTDALSAIGLFVNPAKCSVLNVGGATPGIWPRGSCTPLQGNSYPFWESPWDTTTRPT